MQIRSASTADAGRLLEIYAYYVTDTAISFEYSVPSLEEFIQRIENTLKRYPYLVVEEDGIIKGYSYAGPFAEREAYSRCCALSIYLDKDSRGKGYGRRLYESMEGKLREMGILNLYACIADPIVEDEYLTGDSERFHRHMGFRRAGVFSGCGYKFGRWYNMIWMEKIIGEHLTGEDLVGEHLVGEHPVGEHPVGEHLIREHEEAEGQLSEQD